MIFIAIATEVIASSTLNYFIAAIIFHFSIALLTKLVIMPALVDYLDSDLLMILSIAPLAMLRNSCLVIALKYFDFFFSQFEIFL